MKRSTKRVFSAVYRILQLAFSMGALGVSAAGVYFNGGWDRGNYDIAVGAMSCLYLMATLMLYKFFTAPIALACDSIAFLLWLISLPLSLMFGQEQTAHTIFLTGIITTTFILIGARSAIFTWC